MALGSGTVSLRALRSRDLRARQLVRAAVAAGGLPLPTFNAPSIVSDDPGVWREGVTIQFIPPTDVSPASTTVSFLGAYYDDESAVTGLVGTSYTPVAADAGLRLRGAYRVIGNGHTLTVYTELTGIIEAAPLVPTYSAPYIDSDQPLVFREGVTIRFHAPADLDPVETTATFLGAFYEDDSPVSGETSSAYTPVTGDVGLSIRIAYEIEGNGYTFTAYSAFVGPFEAAVGGVPIVAGQEFDFLSDTRSGAGGFTPVNTGAAITSAEITAGNEAGKFAINATTGEITSAVNGGLTAASLTCLYNGSVSATHTVTVSGAGYSVKNATELAAVSTVALASGKTIKGRGGNYQWVNTTFNNRAYTSEVIVTSHDDANRMQFLWERSGPGTLELRVPKNLTFTGLDFRANFDPIVNKANNHQLGAAMVIVGNIDNLKFTNNRFVSNLLALSAAGWKTTDVTWRGIIGTNSTNVLSGGMTIEDNTFEGSWRLLQIQGGVGTISIKRNEFTDFGTDCIVAGGSFTNIEIHDNIMWRPLTVASAQYSVTVDPVLNRMTTSVPHNFGAAGATLTVNVLPATVETPGGMLKMVDYAAVVVDSTTIRFTVLDITSAGSGVIIWQEPPHGDFIQFATGVGNLLQGSIRRNIMATIRDDDLVFVDEVQLIFIEDNNNSANVDTSHPNLVVEGNIGYSRTNYGAYIANAYNTWIIGNTFVGPPDAVSGSLPYLYFASHWVGSRAGNVARNNITKQVSVFSPTSGGGFTNNLVAYPDAIAPVGVATYSEVFVNPGAPTTPAELLAMYAIKPGGPADTASPKVGSVGTGYVDFTANTSSNPDEPADVTGPTITGVTMTPTGATTADLAATTNTADGTIYWVISTLETRPQPSHMLAGQSSNGQAAAFATSTSVSGSGAQAASATGLVDGTIYYTYALHVDANGNYSVTTRNLPTLSAVGRTVTGRTTANLTATTTGSTGTMYWIVSTSSTRPTAAQVVAGQNHLGAAAPFATSVAVVGSGAQAASATGLTAATSYYVHAVHVDANENPTVVVASTVFITSPALSLVSGLVTGSGGATLRATTDIADGTLYWVLTGVATKPSAAQVIAGQDNTGAAALFATSTSPTTAGAYTAPATGLTPGVAHYLHVVHVDGGAFTSQVVTSSAFTPT